MSKLLLFLLILVGIYLFRRSVLRPPGQAPRMGSAPPPESDRAERMIECAHCGLHVPESEAVAGDGLTFCSEAHRRAHRQAQNSRG